ncbi:energy transducer TonB [Parasphingopyxis sp.]|uniref:energy transducer TonB n=1 Tax=Parasphingopyxis sp. TaxID=1920299 RepID=UPI002621C738|nr:energy transducer TonB [Parasphingopyxis sp.]
MSRLFLWIGFAALASLSGALPAFAQEPLRLEGASPWNIHYADDSCQLARVFGEGEDRATLVMRQYAPGDSFSLIVAGRPFRPTRTDTVASVRLGSEIAVQEMRYLRGTVGEDRALIFFTEALLRPLTDAEREEWTRLIEDEQGHLFDRPVATDDEIAAIDFIEIDTRLGPPVRLVTGSMAPAFEALNACTEELLTHWDWGLDVERHRGISQAARPLGSPGRWVTPSDYPRPAIRSGAQAIVNFRLLVDTDGRVAGCHIQQSIGDEAFDRAVCRALTNRAEFSPALDAEGQPMASYYMSRVVFTIP